MPQVKVHGPNGGITIDGTFDEIIVRSALLLFEHVTHPQQRYISTGLGLSEFCGGLRGAHDALVELGNIDGDPFTPSLSEMFSALDKREPGRWSLARSAQALPFPKNLLGPATGFKIKLENALPVPSNDTPFEDVMNFRERRKDELKALRSHLEGLALEVSRNGVGGLAETHAFEQFQSALDGYARSIAETNWLKKHVGLDVHFSADNAVAKLAGALASGAVFELKGVAIWALATVASMTVQSGFSLKSRKDAPHPFEYVFRAQREI